MIDVSNNSADSFRGIVDAAALMFFFFRDELEAKLDAALVEKTKTFVVKSWSVADRAERIAAIKAELFELEFDEELALRAARDEGHAVLRRHDAAVEAVLQIEVDDSPEPEVAAEPDHPSKLDARLNRLREQRQRRKPRKRPQKDTWMG